MNRFNEYISSHFRSCRVIARAYDDCRKRRVSIHQVPGHWDVVGVSDGTDAWIAPASAGAFFRTATGDVTEIMRRLQAGEPLPPVPDAPPMPSARKRLLRADTNTQSQPQTTTEGGRKRARFN